jgi:hypothetical protein
MPVIWPGYGIPSAWRSPTSRPDACGPAHLVLADFTGLPSARLEFSQERPEHIGVILATEFVVAPAKEPHLLEHRLLIRSKAK